MGEVVCQLLIDRGMVKTPAGIYRLTQEQLLELPGFAKRKAEKILAAIQKSKENDLSQLLFGLGLPGIGEKAAKTLAGRFGSLEKVAADSWEEIAAIDGFGEIMASSLREYFDGGGGEHREVYRPHLCPHRHPPHPQPGGGQQNHRGPGGENLLFGLQKDQLCPGRRGRRQQADQSKPAGHPGHHRGTAACDDKRGKSGMNIDIQHIAKLSRLSIGEDKMEKFQRDMENIVAMVEKLPAVEGQTLAVDPADRMELRRDEIRPSLRREMVLQNAPQSAAGCIVVPKTVE